MIDKVEASFGECMLGKNEARSLGAWPMPIQVRVTIGSLSTVQTCEIERDVSGLDKGERVAV